MKIIVINERKLSEYFNIEIKAGQDLMENQEQCIKDFIEKNKEIFMRANSDEINNFFKQNGLFFTRVIKREGSAEYRENDIYINEWGICYQNETFRTHSSDPLKIFRHHFLVILDENDCYTNKVCIDCDKKYLKIIEEREKRGNLIRKKLSKYGSLSEHFESIKNEINRDLLKKIRLEDIKKIECVPPYDEIFILLNDGTLYLDN